MATEILSARIAATIAEKTRHRMDGTYLQPAAKHVQRRKTSSRSTAVLAIVMQRHVSIPHGCKLWLSIAKARDRANLSVKYIPVPFVNDRILDAAIVSGVESLRRMFFWAISAIGYRGRKAFEDFAVQVQPNAEDAHGDSTRPE